MIVAASGLDCVKILSCCCTCQQQKHLKPFHRAVSFASPLEHGFLEVIIEGDALAVIKLLLSKDRSHAPYGHIIDYAKKLANQFRVDS